MEEEEGGGTRLSKRFSDKGGEVDYKTKAGTAWSHSYLNQKPWHPLSYPNQRRKWITEQSHAQRERRAEEVSREYAQEQEFFRQTALVSKKEKEKMEMMKAVSFMYVRPPGYNAESAKAADMADERKKEELGKESNSHAPSEHGASAAMKLEAAPPGEEKKKPRPKDVFGRALPTEEQFEVLKNAPKLETGVAGRSKPFAVEIRNVKCLRCGNYGHQSGDRECPLKDAIMPNEESRLKRDDPLTAILAQTVSSEPLKWELKQKPGMSPPRGGFSADDPNQKIVAEDIFDEYGGFLGGDDIPVLLTNFNSSNLKKKSSRKKKHKRKSSPSGTAVHDMPSSSDGSCRRSKKKRDKKSSTKHHDSRLPRTDFNSHYDHGDDNRRSTDGDRSIRLQKRRYDKKPQMLPESSSQENSDSDAQYDQQNHRSSSSYDRKRRLPNKEQREKRSRDYSSESDYCDHERRQKRSSRDGKERRSSNRERHKRTYREHSYSSQSDCSDYDQHRKRSTRYKNSHQMTSEDSDSEGHCKKKSNHRQRH